MGPVPRHHCHRDFRHGEYVIMPGPQRTTYTKETLKKTFVAVLRYEMKIFIVIIDPSQNLSFKTGMKYDYFQPLLL